MDAVEFIKAKRKMCCGQGGCSNCTHGDCGCSDEVDAEKLISVVERWAKAHPEKTRQSEFLKMYPNAEMHENYDTLKLCPKWVDTTFVCGELGSCTDGECLKRYWLAEVE